MISGQAATRKAGPGERKAGHGGDVEGVYGCDGHACEGLSDYVGGELLEALTEHHVSC
jgi:hypothetical protein